MRLTRQDHIAADQVGRPIVAPALLPDHLLLLHFAVLIIRGLLALLQKPPYPWTYQVKTCEGVYKGHHFNRLTYMRDSQTRALTPSHPAH